MVKGRVRGGVELMKVLNVMADGVDGTKDSVTRQAMPEHLTPCMDLLIGVGKGDVGPLLHIMPRAVMVGMCWMLALLKVVSDRPKGWLQPWLVAVERVYSPGQQRK